MSLTLVRPFKGMRPLAGKIADVAAPPYDVLDSEEARIMAKGKPISFLHVSKPEIDLPSGTNVYSEEVYAKGRENFQAMIKDGVLVQDKAESYYVYRLRMGEHVQTGLVIGASVEAYDMGRIKKHEFTRPDKEDDRVRQIEAVNAETGPVLLAHPSSSAIGNIISKVASGKPEYDFIAPDGIGHSLWVMDNPQDVAAITAAFEALPALYIADGHHRSAAASRVCGARRKAGEAFDAAHNSFLAVSFPMDEMRIMDYNRVVRDLNGLSSEEFLSKLANEFVVTKASGQYKPQKAREVGLYCAGSWYKLEIKNPATSDPVASLDVSLLSDRLLAPVLGIVDLRKDKRIDFVGGKRGLGELERRVNSGEMAAAFAMFPTQMQDLMNVADADQIMPPKSTWFEPKLADGLVSYML